jgi:addiction module HigA family antidote
MSGKMKPIHPGEVLLEEFLKPMSITQYRLARDIHVQPTRINQMEKRGLRRISSSKSVSVPDFPDTALRLGRYFGMSPQFWMNLQTQYDLRLAADRINGRLEKEVAVRVA